MADAALRALLEDAGVQVVAPRPLPAPNRGIAKSIGIAVGEVASARPRADSTNCVSIGVRVG